MRFAASVTLGSLLPFAAARANGGFTFPARNLGQVSDLTGKSVLPDT